MNEVEIKAKTNDIAMQALSLVIKDEASFERSTQFMEAIKGMKKEITSFITPMKAKANEMHKLVCAQEKKLVEPLDEATAVLKEGRLSYAKPAPLPPPLPAPSGPATDAEGFLPIATPAVKNVAPEAAAAAKATMQIRTTWDAKVVDFKALVAAVAAGKYPISLLLPNGPELKLMAAALKNTGAIDGVVFESRDTETF